MTSSEMGGAAILIGIVMLLAWLFNWSYKLAFPAKERGSTAWTNVEDLRAKTCLTGGPWVITFIRQSGNVHRIDNAATAGEAVAKVQTAFRRAKIYSIRVGGSRPDGFSAYRVIHNARGSSEGKKLGGVKVSRA